MGGLAEGVVRTISVSDNSPVTIADRPADLIASDASLGSCGGYVGGLVRFDSRYILGALFWPD